MSDSNSNVLAALFSDIANAIRTKTGGTDKMAPAAFPENILGIEGGGSVDLSNVKIASGTHTGSASGQETITHNLGVMPDIIFMTYATLGNISDYNVSAYMSGISFSSEFVKATNGVNQSRLLLYNTANGALAYWLNECLDADEDSLGGICGATPNTFNAGNENYGLITKSYYWLAIGGLVANAGYFKITLALDDDVTLLVRDGVPEIEQIEVYVNGEYAKTVDYVYSEEFLIDVSDVSNEFESKVFSVVALGSQLDVLYPYQKSDTVSDNVITGGSCGDGVYWKVYSDGSLKIYGDGAMNDYTAESEQPWYDYKSNITEIQIKNGVSHIGAYAFYGCSAATSITIPDSVTSSGTRAFMGCGKLKSVYFNGTLEQWCKISLVDIYGAPCYNGAALYIGGELLEEAVIPESITEIPFAAFYGCTSLTKVTFHPNLTGIGVSAFRSCTNLSSVLWGDESNVLSIGSYAFYYCSSLTYIVIPASVTSIGKGAFQSSALANANFKDTTTWYRTSTAGATSGGTRLYIYDTYSDNATYLKSTYSGYYWYKL